MSMKVGDTIDVIAVGFSDGSRKFYRIVGNDDRGRAILEEIIMTPLKADNMRDAISEWKEGRS